MPAFGFRARFAAAVEDGTKRQTIRADRKDGRQPARVGQWVTLWAGLRTTSCRKLNAGSCTAAVRISIDGHGLVRIGDGLPGGVHSLAAADGFGSLDEMVEWFRDTHGLPFRGWIIRWDPCGKDALPPPQPSKE